ncbi:protein-L-isoaspartate O-methyltransferase [Thecamonas trahens ATCC 50062]|uniref:Protein-L-isoaspartate O-methyltransferase n=1 Tax=Thecamonas trahens ATCC 50062 TaxID=461836 RepID=A0A0L0DF66_THETB|nr:protein-L-isoaspartate O-methyltransferase [Thecamonas trahens ATCC 50062]KNC50865.1 protein-L-isoaspartate O-methyltransferase [Thecamonas trahens ATCC 50062]|eukprot:XP_013756573.1 protein-L-isoaspartate O-methyltransferase [Thecamonas trahens ATCC 50062]
MSGGKRSKEDGTTVMGREMGEIRGWLRGRHVTVGGVTVCVMLAVIVCVADLDLIQYMPPTGSDGPEPARSEKTDVPLSPVRPKGVHRQSTMAWRSSASTNTRLVEALVRHDVIRSEAVAAAMKAVDRSLFAPSEPYLDAPVYLGWGATISAPHMHAHALEVLVEHLHPDAKLLDVGFGSGYLAAAFAVVIGDGGAGAVYGIEHIDELAEMGRANVAAWQAKTDTPHATIHLSVGNGWDGLPGAGPFDAIHVGAAADDVPASLFDQLAIGGRLIIPVGPDGGYQELVQVDRVDADSYSETVLMGVKYVPLTQTPQAQLDRV